jgi:MoaA/NifB/PqqE/SkfB family radical SAM enzyme
MKRSNNKMSDIAIKYFETTGMCNYKCPICVDRMRNSHMEMDDYYKLIDKNYHLFNQNGVWLDFNGEPLMDPHFFERVKYLKSKGVKVRISTNGALLNETNRRALIESDIDYVVISISTLDPDTYAKIRGVDNLSLVLSNLSELKKDIERLNAHTELQAVMIDTGDGVEREKFIKYFHYMGVHAAFHNFTNRANCIEMDLSVEGNHDFTLKRGLCKGLKENIGSLSNCEVVTCCCDFEGRNSLGNLRDYDYSVEALVNNGKLDAIEDNLKNGVFLGACEDCSDWIYYQENSTEKYVTVYPLK